MTEAHEATNSNPESMLFARQAAELAETGAYDQAITMLNEGLEGHTSYAAGYQVLGDIHARRGDTGKAMEMFDRVLSLDPQNPRVLYLLGKLYLETDPARAQDLLWRARRYEPGVPELEQAFTIAISGPEETEEVDIDIGQTSETSEQTETIAEDTVTQPDSAETIIIDDSGTGETPAITDLESSGQETPSPDEELDLSIVTEQALSDLQAEKRPDNNTDRPLDDRDALEELVTAQSVADTTPPDEMDEVDSELKHILADFDEDSEDISYLVGNAEVSTESEPSPLEDTAESDTTELTEEFAEQSVDSAPLAEDVSEYLDEPAVTDIPDSGDIDQVVSEEVMSVTDGSGEELIEADEETSEEEPPADTAAIAPSHEITDDMEADIPTFDTAGEPEAPDEEPLPDSLIDTDELPFTGESTDNRADDTLEAESSEMLDLGENSLLDDDLSDLYGSDKNVSIETDMHIEEEAETVILSDQEEESTDSDSYASVLAEMDTLSDVEPMDTETSDMETVEEQMIIADIEEADHESRIDPVPDTGELPATGESDELSLLDTAAADDTPETPTAESSETDLSYLYGTENSIDTDMEAPDETTSDSAYPDVESSVETDAVSSDAMVIDSGELRSDAETAEFPLIDDDSLVTDASADEEGITDILSNRDIAAMDMSAPPTSEPDTGTTDYDVSAPATPFDIAPAAEKPDETVYEVTDENHDAIKASEEEAIAAYSKLLRDLDLSGIETDDHIRGVVEIGEEELSSLTFDENTSDSIDEPVLSEEERAELSALESITDEYEAIQSPDLSTDTEKDDIGGTEGHGDKDYNAILGITDNDSVPIAYTEQTSAEPEPDTSYDTYEEADSTETLQEEELESVDLSDIISSGSESVSSDDQAVDKGKIVEEMMRGSMNIRLTPTSEDMEDVDRSSLDSLINEYVSTLESLPETAAPTAEPVTPESDSVSRPSTPPELKTPAASSNDTDGDHDLDSDDIQGESTATMAEIYVRQGLITRAIDIYTRIVEKQPDNVTAQARLNELVQMHINASGDA